MPVVSLDTILGVGYKKVQTLRMSANIEEGVYSSIITAMRAADYRYINTVRKPKYLHESTIHTEDQ